MCPWGFFNKKGGQTMFVDQVEIEVKAGKGGNGLTSFRREAHVPLGGPNGGDGGRGGHVIFEADSNKSTLLDLRYNKLLEAESGENGKSKKMHGKDGKDFVLKVPLGTVVYDAEKNVPIADLTEHGERFIVAKGGRGGRGNTRFATSNNPAPRFSEKGQMGQARSVRLELKLLADVALIGYPSVGKSTLLSVVSRAKPEIAEYPFTTIVPNLGIVETKDHRSFAMADLPGLIEDAHQGKGLGHVFLKHAQRARLFVHVLDMGSEMGRDPLEDFEVINNELLSYDETLEKRPMIVAANKMDMPEAEKNLERFKKVYPDVEIFPLVTLVGEGTDALIYRIADILDSLPKVEEVKQSQTVVYRYEAPEMEYEISRIDGDTWRLEGQLITDLFYQFDFEDDEDFIRFGLRLKKLGIEKALRERGVQHGDTVILENVQFIFDDGMVE